MSESNNDWVFDPNKPRPEGLFKAFAHGQGFGSKVVNNIEATPLGFRIIDFARRVNPLMLFENMPLYSVYVPQEHNLDPTRLDGNGILRVDRPAIVLDNQDIDEAILPFILTGQLFRLMQDKMDEDENRIVPMFQHSVVYNPITRIDDKRMFMKHYEEMERACDVVSLVVLYQMHRMNLDTKAFGLMRAQPHLKDVCSWIAQTGAFIEQSGIGEDDPQFSEDLMLCMGNLAALQSSAYMDGIRAQAEAAYESTMQNRGFAIIAGEEPNLSDDEQDADDLLDVDLDDKEAEDLLDYIEFRKFYDEQRNLRDLSDDPNLLKWNEIDWDEEFGEGFDDEEYYTPPHNGFHFSLLTDTYERRDWDVVGWVERVNKFLEDEKQARADQISEAFKMAHDNEKSRDNPDISNDNKQDNETPVFKSKRQGPKKP